MAIQNTVVRSPLLGQSARTKYYLQKVRFLSESLAGDLAAA